MKTTLSEKVRHLLLHGSLGEPLTDALRVAFRDHGISHAWLRGSGVVSDVVLRSMAEGSGDKPVLRRIAGPLTLLVLEGSAASGENGSDTLELSLRAVLARETDRGMDTLAGELVAARVVTFEAIVTALDDVVPSLLDSVTPPPVEPPGRSLPPPTWSDAIAASPTGVREVLPPAATNSTATGSAPIPPRPVRPGADEGDAIFPEAGDVVDHFAFGRCEVLKSDGDRLHLRVGKDGRVREIALEMLRVQPLPSEGDLRRFRLDRKL